MIRLDYFYSGKASSKVNKRLTLMELLEETKSDAVRQTIEAVRKGEKERKPSLPCVCYMGYSLNGMRKADQMRPTGLVMIDIDHCENPRGAWGQILLAYQGIYQQVGESYPILILAHITPSGHGLRLVFTNHADEMTIEENIKAFDAELALSFHGEVDLACKDLSRVSFLVSFDDILYYSEKGLEKDIAVHIKYDSIEANKPTQKEGKKVEKLYKDFKYGTKLVREIAEEYCAYYFPEGNHTPPQGSVHTFYNQMVKDFRCICDNKPEILISVLPQFGHSDEECLSQCRSICQRNNLSKLPKPFYFFLKDRNWYVNPFEKQEAAKAEEEEPEDPYKQLDALIDGAPKLPPVFRQYINSAPRYFKIPYLMSLLPVMGTLTSYLEGMYNGKVQTTSFMSVIYAPPSSGKSYMVELAEQLLNQLAMRDAVSAARDNIYSKMIKMKGANEKAPEDPRTPQRIMPAINSIPKILSKMSNNAGYHMFTAVEEMDTWIKGSKGRDGDKNDMYRVAWDNGKYGQSFMSAQTFNGIVRLYWNVLITGTIDQVLNYFRNIENGMITRCSFTDLGDQMFTLAPVFKKISERDQEIIEKWKNKCDANTYLHPLDIDMNALYDVKDEDFDNKIAWKQEFRPRQEVNIDWIIPHLNKWCTDQNLLASKNTDNARGVFHRRVAVRGYRLAMICTTLYDKIRDREKQVIVDFVLWFMECDLYGILKLFGAKYNEHYVKSASTIKEYKFADLYDALPDVFETSDLIAQISKSKFSTNHYTVLSIWKKAKLIEKIEKNKFKKIKKK